MLNENDKNRIMEWYNKYCYSNKLDSDLFDIHSEIDRNISVDENINILEDKLNQLKANGTLNDRMTKKQLITEQNRIKESVPINQTINVRRILNNSLSILMSRTNEAKTSFLCSLIKEYQTKFTGNVYVFGLNPILVKTLNVIPFYSLIELEKIKNGIIIIDEVKTLFCLEDRKKFGQIESVLRLVNHNNNRLLLAGLPTDFKKFICAKATCFMYKGLDIGDLINGSRAKDFLNQYTGTEKGSFNLDIPKNEVLCYDNSFWKESFSYNSDYDTKKSNSDLFSERVISPIKSGNKVPEIVEIKKGDTNANN
jgi:hypothetical protein